MGIWKLHSIRSCLTARTCQRVTSRLFGPSLVDSYFPSSVKHQLLAWEGHLGENVKYKSFPAIPHAIFWLIWIERNRKLFDGVETCGCLKTSGSKLYNFGRRRLFLFDWSNQFCGQSLFWDVLTSLQNACSNFRNPLVQDLITF